MIARGKIHSSGPKLAAYLLNGKEGEKAELVEMRGMAAGALLEGFSDLQHMAESTNCRKPFFHGYVRLPDDERLSREQWLEIAERMERKLGFEGQPRAVAFHHGGPEGNHLHVGWYRIDGESGKAIDPGLYINKMREEAAQLEKDFGLRQLDRRPNPNRLTKPALQGEFEQSRRLGTRHDEIRNGIREAWDASDGGASLAAAIRERGWMLARGDRRDFVVVDERGGDHALSKRICGITAGEIKSRLGGDEFKATLPHIDQAKEIQASFAKMRETERASQSESSGAFQQRRAADRLEKIAASLEGKASGESVEGRATKAAHGMEKVAMRGFEAMCKTGEKLFDLVSGAADFFFATPRMVTAKEAAADAQAFAEYARAAAFTQQREMAYDRMAEERAAGKHLTRDDVRYLSEADRANYRAHGDTALDQMFRDREIEVERERHGRFRER